MGESARLGGIAEDAWRRRSMEAEDGDLASGARLFDKHPLMPSESNEGAPGVPADLRMAEELARGYVQGDAAAADALLALGRDASFVVMKVAQGLGNHELLEFGRRLVAVRPDKETNLFELRRDSVAKVVERRLPEASLASEARFEGEGGALAIFDPMRVAHSLARGGRPRRDLARVRAGDIAWVGLPSWERFHVRLSTRPPVAGQPVRSLALTVDSGLVFVGPPEASDGPRLGALRLDPFATQLNAYVDRGLFVRLKPGSYVVSVYWRPKDIAEVSLVSRTPEGPFPEDLADLEALETIPWAEEDFGAVQAERAVDDGS